jgi:molecular chaperone GrpE
VTEPHVDPDAEPLDEPGQFGGSASEMASETEVEEEPAAEAPSSAPEAEDVVAEDELASDPVVEEGEERARLETALAERTSDLQRLQAEFLNYKRRVDRDRDLLRENATYAVLAPVTEVLDTIDRAREHGELDGGFKAVAEQLERIVAGLGLTRFGAVGDPFDPTVHEALSHIGEDPEVTVTTCKVIAKAGYKIGDRVVRAAQVLVVDPVSQPIDQPIDQPVDQPVGPTTGEE